MLINFFNLTIAQYHSLDELDVNEIKQSDLLVFRDKIRGGIYHPRQVVWKGNLEKIKLATSFIRSSRERKVLAKNKQLLEREGYQIKTLKLTKNLFKEFKKIYQKTVLKKERALHFDLDSIVFDKIITNKPIYIIGLFSENQLLSGLIFSIKKNNEVLVAVGAKKRFPHLRGGIGGVFELELLQFCLDKKIKEISHGVDTHPAGLAAKSGIFEFKARYGYTAFPTNYWQTTFILSRKAFLSEAVFITIIDDQFSYLVVTDSIDKGTANKYKTKLIDKVRTITFDEIIHQHHQQLNIFKQQEFDSITK